MLSNYKRRDAGLNAHFTPVKPADNRLTRLLCAALMATALLQNFPASFAAGVDLDAEADPKPAQPLILNNLSGDQYDLSQSNGRVVLVNFWAVWCAPCRAEMPSMQQLNQQFDREDFEIVAVDMGSSRKHIDAFLDEMNPRLEFTIVRDETGEAASAWGVRGIPVSFIIDRQGNLAYKATGERDWSSAEIKATLQALIDRP